MVFYSLLTWGFGYVATFSFLQSRGALRRMGRTEVRFSGRRRPLIYRQFTVSN